MILKHINLFQHSTVLGRIFKKYDSFEERGDQDRRKKNLMLFGVPERSFGYDVDETNDRTAVENILRILLPFHLHLDVNHVRVGRVNYGKNRPIKVSFNEERLVRECVENSQALRKSEYSHVFVGFDLTPNQLDEYYQLKKELEYKNDNSENTYKIQYFDRTPMIVKVSE